MGHPDAGGVSSTSRLPRAPRDPRFYLHHTLGHLRVTPVHRPGGAQTRARRPPPGSVKSTHQPRGLHCREESPDSTSACGRAPRRARSRGRPEAEQGSDRSGRRGHRGEGRGSGRRGALGWREASGARTSVLSAAPICPGGMGHGGPTCPVCVPAPLGTATSVGQRSLGHLRARS